MTDADMWNHSLMYANEFSAEEAKPQNIRGFVWNNLKEPNLVFYYIVFELHIIIEHENLNVSIVKV
jgi:hypothetical protein